MKNPPLKFALLSLCLLAVAGQWRVSGILGPVKNAAGERRDEIAGYTKALAGSPDDATKATDYFLRGKAYYEGHEIDRALADFTAAIGMRKDNDYAYTLRGDCYLEKKQFDKALDDFDEVIRIQPKNFKVMGNRGVAFDMLQQYDKAIEAYSESIDVNPDFAKTRLNRARDYLQTGQPEKALDDCNKAIQLDPKNAVAFNNRAEAFLAMDEADKALEDYNTSIGLDPGRSYSYEGRGHIYMESGDYAKAKEDLGKAAQLDPKADYALNDLAWLLSVCPKAEIRDGKSAVGYATRACELTHWQQPTHVDTLAAAYAEAGDFDNAVKYEQQFVKYPGMGQEDIDRANGLIHLYQSHKPYREGDE